MTEYTCYICGRVYVKQAWLDQHLEVHQLQEQRKLDKEWWAKQAEHQKPKQSLWDYIWNGPNDD